MTGPKLLFQDMTFTVTDHADIGVEIAFEGRYDDEVTSGSKWFLDEAATEVRAICAGLSSVHPHKGVLLSRLTHVESLWNVLDRAETRWSRETPSYVIVVSREGRMADSDSEGLYWLQTVDGDTPIGPYATHEIFDARGARRVARELCLESAPVPSA